MVKIGIVGGTGYTGVELLRILASHPEARGARHHVARRRGHAGRRHVPEPARRVRPARVHRARRDRPQVAATCVFFATPHGVAMAQARGAASTPASRIIDLAADFRLKDVALFEKWYKLPHACPDLLAEAVYGLPEVNREQIRKARIVGNPGCYPTAMQLGFCRCSRPASSTREHLIADCKSGASRRRAQGRGGPAPRRSLRQLQGLRRCRPSPSSGDPCRSSQARSKTPVKLVFTPHLLPMIRGIHATLYARLTRTDVDLQALFEKRYAGEPFVDVMPPGIHARHAQRARRQHLPHRRAPPGQRRHGRPCSSSRTTS